MKKVTSEDVVVTDYFVEVKIYDQEGYYLSTHLEVFASEKEQLDFYMKTSNLCNGNYEVKSFYKHSYVTAPQK